MEPQLFWATNNCILHAKTQIILTTDTIDLCFTCNDFSPKYLSCARRVTTKSKNPGHIWKKCKTMLYLFFWIHSCLKVWSTGFNTSNHKWFQVTRQLLVYMLFSDQNNSKQQMAEAKENNQVCPNQILLWKARTIKSSSVECHIIRSIVQQSDGGQANGSGLCFRMSRHHYYQTCTSTGIITTIKFPSNKCHIMR